MYNPKSDVIIIEEVEMPKERGGIIIKQDVQDLRQKWFKVTAIGPGDIVDGNPTPENCKVGDLVIVEHAAPLDSLAGVGHSRQRWVLCTVDKPSLELE